MSMLNCKVAEMVDASNNPQATVAELRTNVAVSTMLDFERSTNERSDGVTVIRASNTPKSPTISSCLVACVLVTFCVPPHQELFRRCCRTRGYRCLSP